MTGFLIVDELLNAPPGRKQNRRVKPPPPKPAPNLSQYATPISEKILIGNNLYIRANYIVSIPEWHFSNRYKSQAFHENKKNLRNNSHRGLLSAKAQTNIKNSINWLVMAAKQKRVYSKKEKKEFKFKIAFITLTLPDTGTPISPMNFQKQLLNPFLVYLRKYHQLKNYVWKMEYQANGKLHCHITHDVFIHWADIRKCWNRLLEKNGYLNDFEKKFGHKNPNSTDIHSVQKIKDVAAYLAKYMSKPASITGEYKGRIWGCSYDLSRANKLNFHLPVNQFWDVMPCLNRKEIRKHDIIQCIVKEKKEVNIGEMYLLNKINWQKHIEGEIKEIFNQQIKKIQSPIQYFEINELILS